MRYFITILFFFFYAAASAQKADSADLVRCVASLNKALIKPDSFRLKLLLRNDVHYYHSNGWLQSKREVIEDLYNGKLVYKKITPFAQEVHFIDNNLAEVAMQVDIDVALNGKPVVMKLNVVQSWAWNKERWELVSRVSKRVQTKDDQL